MRIKLFISTLRDTCSHAVIISDDVQYFESSGKLCIYTQGDYWYEIEMSNYQADYYLKQLYSHGHIDLSMSFTAAECDFSNMVDNDK